MMGSRVRVTQAAPAISTPSSNHRSVFWQQQIRAPSKASQLPFSDCPAATRSRNCDPRELTIVAWRRSADAGSVRGNVTGLSQFPVAKSGTGSRLSRLCGASRATARMDPTIDYYRRQAARCEDWAETASNPQIRAEYKRLALAWLSLANFRHTTSVPAEQPENPVTRSPR